MLQREIFESYFVISKTGVIEGDSVGCCIELWLDASSIRWYFIPKAKKKCRYTTCLVHIHGMVVIMWRILLRCEREKGGKINYKEV